MISRFLLPLFVLVLPGAFGQMDPMGQMGLYGPVTTRLKAGDLAPDIQFAKVLSTPGEAKWSPLELTGQLTILIFYLDTSHNLQTITMWNSLVDSFARKPVQFLFISGEEDRTLLPWLRQHPIKGWVFHDPEGKTGRAYGLEEPATVFIGSDGKIIGFGRGFRPQESEVNAALEGRITTVQPTRAAMNAFLASGQVLLNPEPPRMPRFDDHKPKFPPSYALHVSNSESEGSGNSSGPDFVSLDGYTLKAAIQYLYGVNPIRVVLPAVLNDGRHYDFSMVLPEPENSDKLKARFQDEILAYFHLTMRREERQVGTYVVTAAHGREPPVLKPASEEEMGGISGGSMDFEAAAGPDGVMDGRKPLKLNRVRGVSFDGTVDGFCYMLEASLDRPVVNETNLQGQFRFQTKRNEGAANDFLQQLRDQEGLVITPSTRNVETLVFVTR